MEIFFQWTRDFRLVYLEWKRIVLHHIYVSHLFFLTRVVKLRRTRMNRTRLLKHVSNRWRSLFCLYSYVKNISTTFYKQCIVHFRRRIPRKASSLLKYSIWEQLIESFPWACWIYIKITQELAKVESFCCYNSNDCFFLVAGKMI